MVFSFDEKTQVQALDRTQPSLPLKPGTGIRHVRIPPRRPQLNSKVERFNRTMTDEWAYVRVYRSDTERTNALADWLHT